MNVRFYWAVREILRQKRRTLLLFCVSFAAMLTVLSALTNAAAAFWQQDTFADSLAFPLETILHLDYGDMEENPSLPHTLRQYRAYIAGLPGVQAGGAVRCHRDVFCRVERPGRLSGCQQPGSGGREV